MPTRRFILTLRVMYRDQKNPDSLLQVPLRLQHALSTQMTSSMFPRSRKSQPGSAGLHLGSPPNSELVNRSARVDTPTPGTHSGLASPVPTQLMRLALPVPSQLMPHDPNNL